MNLFFIQYAFYIPISIVQEIRIVKIITKNLICNVFLEKNFLIFAMKCVTIYYKLHMRRCITNEHEQTLEKSCASAIIYSKES